MGIKISKYEFADEASALAKINALPSVKDEEGNDVPAHAHTIVKLGKIILQAGEYDADGEEVKAPVLSDKYHVDVLWKNLEEVDEDGNVSVDHPYGWKSFALDLDNEGVHGFMGVSYLENKM